VVTVSFAEERGKTRMTFHQASFGTADTRDSHGLGWNESFDMLAEHLALTPNAQRQNKKEH
jgi:uncharacterized protein YndB with AHSA1/START domain